MGYENQLHDNRNETHTYPLCQLTNGYILHGTIRLHTKYTPIFNKAGTKNKDKFYTKRTNA
jgi:hypothetical protein